MVDIKQPGVVERSPEACLTKEHFEIPQPRPLFTINRSAGDKFTEGQNVADNRPVAENQNIKKRDKQQNIIVNIFSDYSPRPVHPSLLSYRCAARLAHDHHTVHLITSL
ncbi:hypothetical protein D3C75_752210 [compost metagenome]